MGGTKPQNEKNTRIVNRNILLTTILLITAIFHNKANAQGCVGLRQMGGINTLFANNTYNLTKGSWQVGTNYRYFHSWRHFIGTEEQPQRQTTGGGIGMDGKDRGNAVNIYSHAIDFNISYAISNRFQLNLTLPYVHNERSQVLKQTKPVVDTFRYSIFAKGIGDIRLGFNYWVFDPALSQKGNLMLGAALKLPTGRYDAVDQAPQSNGTYRYAIVDQAIQPGDGGLGFSVEMQAFTQLGKNFVGFASGYYLFNPRENNGVSKSAAKPGLEGYNNFACTDQYLARAGVSALVGKMKNVSLSLAGRWEGIPAYDAIGGSVGFRRPGYVIAVEPGISFFTGNHTFTLFVPYNFVKNRVQSPADIADQNLQNSKITDPAQQVHVQGDAAFADYSINIGYSFRIPQKHKTAASILVPAHH